MKHLDAKHVDQVMRYFTPELYTRFNSNDEKIADRANDEWEEAVAAYRRRLEEIRERMPSHVRQLTELCVHDAELLSIEQEAQSFLCREPLGPRHVWDAIAIVAVRQPEGILALIYFLWDQIRQYPGRADWPFANGQKYWMYDEVDLASEYGEFVHRVLFSDGSVVEIPFVSVVRSHVPLPAVPQSGLERIPRT